MQEIMVLLEHMKLAYTRAGVLLRQGREQKGKSIPKGNATTPKQIALGQAQRRFGSWRG